MAEVKRLTEFYDFDPAVLMGVAQAHAQHENATFAEIADRYNLDDNTAIVPGGEYGKAIEILTLKPKGNYDETTARIMHLPIACPLDQAQAMQAMHNFAADPSEQLIVVGNAGGLGRAGGKLSFTDSRAVSQGDLYPTVDPLLAYLQGARIVNTRHFGSSFGAAKVMAASAGAARFGIKVSQAVAIEPPNVYPRTLGELAKVFKHTKADLEIGADGKTEKVDKLKEAIARSEIPAVVEAHELADKGLVRYMFGLLRPTNIGIAAALASERFGAWTDLALKRQPGLHAAVFWGEKSELALDDIMLRRIDRLYGTYNSEKDQRYFAAQVKKMRHADINDVDLQTALVQQGLRRTAGFAAAALALAC